MMELGAALHRGSTRACQLAAPGLILGITENLFDVAQIYQQCCLDERLNYVDQNNLVLEKRTTKILSLPSGSCRIRVGANIPRVILALVCPCPPTL